MAVESVSGVTADPQVAFGKPVIAGTRVPVALVLGQLAGGVPVAERCAEYELTPEQVRAAMRYAAWLAAGHDAQDAKPRTCSRPRATGRQGHAKDRAATICCETRR